MSKLLAYLQLIRLPNVFTAMADVAMGFFVTHEIVRLSSLDTAQFVMFGLLTAASAALYSAGMALNDVFDAQIDRAERPERPIPSQRVSLFGARGLGFGLLATGVLLGIGLSIAQRDFRPASVSLGLAVAVVAYDAVLKRTPLGPVGMGLCRFLNVLLGMSLSPVPWGTWNYVVAGGIGLFIVGVTWFARTEATTSSRGVLLLAMAVGGAGLALLAAFPRFAPVEGLLAAVENDPGRWNLLWILLGALVGWRCLWAVIDPRPQLVQRAVRQCIFSLIMFDAVVTYAVCGFVPAALILLLLLPTMFLGQFIYST